MARWWTKLETLKVEPLKVEPLRGSIARPNTPMSPRKRRLEAERRKFIEGSNDVG